VNWLLLLIMPSLGTNRAGRIPEMPTCRLSNSTTTQLMLPDVQCR